MLYNPAVLLKCIYDIIWEILLQCRLDLVGLGRSQKFCISNKLTGDADDAGLSLIHMSEELTGLLAKT